MAWNFNVFIFREKWLPPQIILLQPQRQQEQLKRSNDGDPFSYLDKVKLQFRTQREVYDGFLDIMKDFKSQT